MFDKACTSQAFHQLATRGPDIGLTRTGDISANLVRSPCSILGQQAAQDLRGETNLSKRQPIKAMSNATDTERLCTAGNIWLYRDPCSAQDGVCESGAGHRHEEAF